MKKNSLISRIIAIISSLELTVLLLFLLSLLVVWGTLYQVDNGIYAAQERFFNAWFTMVAGIVPFPVLKTIVILLSVNLLAAAFRKRPLSIVTAGLFIIHIGVVVLVAGTAVTSSLNKESAINLQEGQSTAEAFDFSSWQLTFFLKNAATTTIVRFDFDKLRPGQKLTLIPGIDPIYLHTLHTNCGVMRNEEEQKILSFKPLPPSTERGRNVPGCSIVLGEEQYFAYAGLTYPVNFLLGDYSVQVSLLPEALALPLRMQLNRFEIQWHPGTTNARSYKSFLRVLGKNIDREVVVEMNRPFRYGAYTVYQMGYTGTENNYATTLAIVRNPLRYMPYISSCIIVIGMFIHFFVKMWIVLYSKRGALRDKQ